MILNFVIEIWSNFLALKKNVLDLEFRNTSFTIFLALKKIMFCTNYVSRPV